MRRINFRAIGFVLILSALMLNSNLLAGAQEKPKTGSEMERQKAVEKQTARATEAGSPIKEIASAPDMQGAVTPGVEDPLAAPNHIIHGDVVGGGSTDGKISLAAFTNRAYWQVAEEEGITGVRGTISVTNESSCGEMIMIVGRFVPDRDLERIVDVGTTFGVTSRKLRFLAVLCQPPRGSDCTCKGTWRLSGE